MILGLTGALETVASSVIELHQYVDSIRAPFPARGSEQMGGKLRRSAHRPRFLAPM
jgi:hypothetical protein